MYSLLSRHRNQPQPNPFWQHIAQHLRENAELYAAGASGGLIIMGWIMGHLNAAASSVLYLLAIAVGGYVNVREGLQILIKERELDVNLLMIAAAIGAISIGYWAEGAVLIFIFSLSGALETYTSQRSSRDISKLMELKPETALLLQNGREVEVPIGELAIGDRIVVKAGERIPADGVIAEGKSAVNQASITGESIPVDKEPGDEVFAGTLNGQGALFVDITRSSESTLFAKIIRLVQEAQQEMPKSQRFMLRFERIYAKAIVAATALLMFLPHFIVGWSWRDTLYRAMVFLVVASPCALVASIMPAMLSAISNSARHGFLFKGGAHLENLSQVKVFAFDKTGTLTEGKPAVTDVVPVASNTMYGPSGSITEEDVLEAAAALESLSTHPLAKSIVDEAEKRKLHINRPVEFLSLTGWGVQGRLKGELWKVGKVAMMEGLLTTDIKACMAQLENQGKTVVLVQNSQEIVGLIALQDRIREESRQAISRLHEIGVEVAMLTGDKRETAYAIAREAGIDRVFAELLPDDKVRVIKELKEQVGFVAMVGDGVNDAPALATATVGIAMGGTGSDAALETADLVLMNDDLTRLRDTILLGRRMRSIVKQNIVFAVLVIITLITSNFWFGIQLPLGVIGHEGSTILVILNGLRLLR
jgi:Zn2+/Cd2+-exporting ATPase